MTPSESRGRNKLQNEERRKNLTIIRSCGDNHNLAQQFNSLRFKRIQAGRCRNDFRACLWERANSFRARVPPVGDKELATVPLTAAGENH